MNRSVKLALVQQHATHDINDNLKRGIEAFEKAARQGAQVIAFAELAFTYFYPQHPATGDVSRYAQSIPGPMTDTFSGLSRKYEVVTILNLFEKHGDKTYDASPVIDADGTLLGVSRMVHIIDAPCFHETGYYTPGPGEPLVFDTRYGRIGIAICYDRHFPEYMRTLGLQGAEIAVVPQAGAVGEWPPGLFEAEMQVAGFQNGYFTALCNRVGQEDCITFEGKSFVTAPDGRIVAQAPALQDALLFADIDLGEVAACHARCHFLPDRRPGLYPSWLRRK